MHFYVFVATTLVVETDATSSDIASIIGYESNNAPHIWNTHANSNINMVYYKANLN